MPASMAILAKKNKKPFGNPISHLFFKTHAGQCYQPKSDQRKQSLFKFISLIKMFRIWNLIIPLLMIYKIGTLIFQIEFTLPIFFLSILFQHVRRAVQNQFLYFKSLSFKIHIQFL